MTAITPLTYDIDHLDLIAFILNTVLEPRIVI
jgi:hypothetical protein